MRDLKYRRIADALRQQCIESGEGTRLPSEKELALTYGVSPMTVRRALEVLEDEGLVIRIFGRGTYVQRLVVAKGDELTSFSEDMRNRGLVPSTRLLGIAISAATTEVAADLRLSAGDRVLQIERLRLAGDEPMAVELAHLPERFARAVEENADGSLHETLAGLGARPVSATRRIRAVITTDRQSALLSLPPGAPALRIVQVFADERGQLVERADSFYRADRYEAHTQVRRS
jgi:GntR family transcriptional regulator